MPVPEIYRLKDVFEIASQIAESRLQFCLDGALLEVKRKIGAVAYSQVFQGVTSTLIDTIDDTDTTNVNETADRISAVENAVLYFAMSDVLLNANLRIRSSGSVKKEQNAGSPGIGSGSQVTNEYLTPKELSDMRQSLRAKGELFITPYEPDETTDFSDSFEIQRG